ncbi:ATP-binding protein [Opacimonas viscosa]|uniref:histidine kinase n=1 Tax=Opacimonas viscosa TaxID=2961944 RepID=A0AA41X2D8_9ALTE|nr:ATP-binding protein [Opacimonas viscosa]MCP3427364.1 ATP-binding protein [Opacimonas viscosa]
MDLYTKYSNLLEQSTLSGLWEYDYESESMQWSPNVFAIFECEPDLYTPSLESQSGFYLPASLEKLLTHIEYLESIQKSSDIILDIRTALGKPKTIQLSLHADFIDNQIIKRYGRIQDITVQHNQKIENDFFRERLLLALQASGTGTWDYDVQADSLYWDDSMFAIFDVVSHNEITSFRNWLSLIHPDDRDTFIDHFNRGSKGLAESNSIFVTCRILSALGRISYIKVNAKFYIDESNRNIRILGTCVDTTESELIQQQIVNQATIAQQNMIKAQDASETQKRFLANMSHEIRTPLNTMMGALQILQSFQLDEDSHNLVEMAYESSSDLLSLLNDILDLSKIDAHEMAIENIDLNIADLIYSAVDKFRLNLEPSVALNVDIPDDFVAKRLGDPIRFNQVLNNLLSNAIKFTLEGQVTVSLSGDDNMVSLAISDTGIGIPKSKQESIFQPFKQADDSTTRTFGGTGLGLAICSSLAALMSAELTVASNVGKGSTFTFTVPMRINTKTLVQDNITFVKTPDLSGKRILVAEDTLSNQKMLALMLAETHADLIIVSDGQQALDEYISTTNFDVIILDLHMPLLNGRDTCRKLRKINKLLPIFALTADVLAENNKAMLVDGFDEVLTKPLNKHILFEKLANYCLDEVDIHA